MSGADLAAAFARCEEITRTEAKNFAYGIRLLPAPKRQAMSALYAFARRVDDVGDGAGSAADKLEALAKVRAQIDSVEQGSPRQDDPVLVALSDSARRYPIPLEALRELVTGCEMDCRQQRYETFDDLVVYCRCVAGSIGRLSLSVFGSSDDSVAPGLADTLGVGLQVTNVLRDIVEDRDVMGRVYLPAEDLERFGCAPDASGPLDALADVVRFESGRAKQRYAEGLELLGLLDHRSRACVSAMAGIYRRLLDRIEHDPLAVLDHRVSVPAWEKAWVAARSLAGVGA
ncbi:MAG: presqualene diphosphate synthase HpnD [Actinomycetota bacterium]|nr:presqualene diphosphate synthase HpnD [Actinomycetota bacterium]